MGKTMKAILCVNKSKPYLVQGIAKPMHTLDANNPFNFNWRLVKKGFFTDRLNGKIVGECDFEVEEITYNYLGNSLYDFNGMQLHTKTLKESEISQCSKLNSNELRKCLLRTEDDYINLLEVGYVIHINDLHMFDHPKETGEFYTRSQKVVSDIICDSCTNFDLDCKKCPNNYEYESIRYIRRMMKVYGEAGFEEYIAIPVTSEEMCRVANKEQTILVRKTVLKEMIQNE